MSEKSDQKNLKIVWLTVNCSYSHSSLALPLIHAACSDIPGWDWERVEVTIEEDSAAVASRITNGPCDLLCTSLYLFNREKVFDVLKRVKVLSPYTHIAVGGPECPACDAARILNENPFISTVFSGEGEGIFPEFLRSFSDMKDRRSAIPAGRNACYEAWHDSPFPVEDEFFRTDKPFVQMETTRGCPMACAYCTSSGVKNRCRDLLQVERELSLLDAKGVKEIRVLDRTFNLPQERGAALLNLFAKFPDIRFHLEVHPQFLGPELRKTFLDSRTDQLHVEAGIQSLDPLVQRAIGRKSDPEQALDGLRFLISCPTFETHTDLLAGLPMQTLDSLKKDLVTLMLAGPAEIQLEVLKILPGTPIKKELENYGIRYSPAPPYDVMKTDTMSTDDVLMARKISRWIDLFYNHRALHPVICAAVQERRDAFLILTDFLQAAHREADTMLDLKKRFLLLFDFMQRERMPLASDELAFQWLMSGYPAGEGPALAAQTVRSVPDPASLLHGSGECLTHRETKLRSLPYRGETLFFAYNRNFAFNVPCAVFRKDHK